MQTSLDQLQRAEALARERLAGLGDRLQSTKRELDQLRERHTAARERAAVLEEFERRRDGYSEAVKQVLAQAQSGAAGLGRHVLGVVAELLTVNVEMAATIEVALGERAQHVVVSSLDDVLASLAHSPQRQPGQVTFTPVVAHGGPPTGRQVNLQGRPGVIGRADQCVQTMPQFVPLANRLLGDTWIVETIEHATALARDNPHLSFVTPAGELLSNSGSLSVGADTPASGLISRRAELESLRARSKSSRPRSPRARQPPPRCPGSCRRCKNRWPTASWSMPTWPPILPSRACATAARKRAAQIEKECERLDADRTAAVAAAEAAEAGLQTAQQRLEASKRTLADIEQQTLEFARQVAALDCERTAAAAVAAQPG